MCAESRDLRVDYARGVWVLMAGDVTDVGPPIDSARLWWFIKRHRFTANEPSEEYRRAYNAALDDLTTWLRSAGY